jgi:adenylate cyclase
MKEREINILNKNNEIKEAEISKQKTLRNSFFGGFAIVLIFAGVFLSQRNKIRLGKKRSDELLLNILPEEVADELKKKGSADARQFDHVTVLFTDFKNFTQLSGQLSARELVEEINYCYSNFDRIITEFGIEKIKTIGDSYMCVGGLPAPDSNHAIKTVKAALAIRDFMVAEKIKRAQIGQSFFEIRIGLHSGPVVAGIVGIKKFAYDIWGDTVNIASRMESSGEEGMVNISDTIYLLIKDKFECKHRGKIAAKNKGDIDMFFVIRSLGEG